jgi:hypothetical protein
MNRLQQVYLALGVFTLIVISGCKAANTRAVKSSAVNAAVPDTLSAPPEIKPIIHIRPLLAVKPTEIKSALMKDMGSGVKFSFDKRSPEWKAERSDAWVTVGYFKNRVACVNVFFTPQVNDLSVALAAIDLKPYDKTPSFSTPAVAKWDDIFEGIDKVFAVRLEKNDGHSVDSIGICPDKFLAKEWGDAPQS